MSLRTESGYAIKLLCFGAVIVIPRELQQSNLWVKDNAVCIVWRTFSCARALVGAHIWDIPKGGTPPKFHWVPCDEWHWCAVWSCVGENHPVLYSTAISHMSFRKYSNNKAIWDYTSSTYRAKWKCCAYNSFYTLWLHLLRAKVGLWVLCHCNGYCNRLGLDLVDPDWPFHLPQNRGKQKGLAVIDLVEHISLWCKQHCQIHLINAILA